jgi:hypothetical protein
MCSGIAGDRLELFVMLFPVVELFEFEFEFEFEGTLPESSLLKEFTSLLFLLLWLEFTEFESSKSSAMVMLNDCCW